MGVSQMTCTELTEQDDAPQHHLHETGYVGPLWCLEESTHLRMSQSWKKPEWWRFYLWKKNWNSANIAGRRQAQWRNNQISVQIETRCLLGVGKAKSKRYVLRRLLKVATQVDEGTVSGRLFQREEQQDLNARAPALVVILGTDRVIQSDGSGDVGVCRDQYLPSLTEVNYSNQDG